MFLRVYLCPEFSSYISYAIYLFYLRGGVWGDSKFEFQCYWGLRKSKALLLYWGGGGYVA